MAAVAATLTEAGVVAVAAVVALALALDVSAESQRLVV